MTTIKMVAQRAGVSTATVSRALSNPDVVVPETRARIREAVEALGYSPNFAAKNLRTFRSQKIIVMVPDVANPFFSEVLRGAEDAAQLAGYSVLLGDTRDDEDREAQYAEMLLRREADGLIFLGYRLPPVLARLVEAKGAAAPIVNGCDFSAKQGVSSVHIDNAKAAGEATDLLYSLGHRRVAVIAGPAESNITRDRLGGVLASAAASGHARDLVVLNTDYTIEAGLEETARLLARDRRPTAIFCFSDEIAVGALTAAREAGLAVPADLSIVGFDDVRYARFTNPPLTTIRQPMNQLGQTMVKLLISILQGAQALDWVTLGHELVVRGSTGPPPNGD